MRHVAPVDTAPAAAGAPIAALVVPALTARAGEPAGEVRQRAHGMRHGTASHVALVDDGGRFVGMVRATDLMAAPADLPMTKLAMADPPVVAATESRERAAWEVTRRGESEMAVADASGVLLGMVPAPRVLAILVRQHDDDLARIGGYLHQGDSARRASSESVSHRLVHRLPWLIAGLAGSLGAAWLMSGFEGQLTTVVSLAFFVPSIVYLADAVGNQTGTIALRGMSVGVGIRETFVRDSVTGLLIGLMLGAAFLGPAWLLVHDWYVAGAVSVALVCACSIASCLALAIPWLLARSGIDPAFGSGPLATVIQDITSILVYFAVAVALVPEL